MAENDAPSNGGVRVNFSVSIPTKYFCEDSHDCGLESTSGHTKRAEAVIF
jgi:hypothetical protein